MSHQHLLLCGHPRGEDSGTWYLDLFFEGVFYIELPYSLKGLEIVAPTAADQDHLAARYETPPGDAWYYVLVSEEKRYYVGAMRLTVEHNNRKYWEKPSSVRDVAAREES